MPKPRKGESKNDFMKRCVPEVVEEGKPQNQAVAICNSLWEENKSNKEFSWNVNKIDSITKRS